MRYLTSLFFALCTAFAGAAPSVNELSQLFLPAEFGQPKLSPDGKFIAFLARNGDDYSIGLCDLSTGQTDLSKGDGKARPIDFWWKTPRRLLVQVSNNKLNALAYTIFDLDRRTTEDAWHLDRQPGRIFDAQPQDPKHVLMVTSEEIRRINLSNGKAENVDRPPTRTSSWVVDSQGRARAVYQSIFRFGVADLWWRSVIGGEWRHQHFTATDRRFVPQAVDADGLHLWGWEMASGKETVFARFNTQSGERTTKHFPPNLPPTDLLMLGSTRQPVAVAYAQGKDVALFALNASDEAAVSRLQTTFAGFFPIIVDALPDKKTWLVWIGNSRLPGAYFLFNRQTGEASLIAQSHGKNIVEDKLAAADYFTFTARNGGQLTARLWRPPGKSTPPLIVYCPRQLPPSPTADLYQADVQAFVAQGFAVLQVNIRGTDGFGATPTSLGDENWSTNIRDDLEDAANHLANQQIVNPSRVYLYGTWFGGVLALEIATTSTRFAAIATVNIPSKVSRNDLFRYTDDSGLNGMTARLCGWAETNKIARELSPLQQVTELKTPALYLHNEDTLKGQPVQDGREIRSAVKKSSNAQTGLAYSWSDRLKAPSKLAAENAAISLQIGNFFNQFRSPDSTAQTKP
ncbi:prolyl oligopeptidase family serine peptidase [Oleiharenicola lentus]|uniref:alpha/beta hydrolase family protein n=1 Tax=Oleiharenicola lentus TaxID=2508720 RepID=UPI003F680407